MTVETNKEGGIEGGSSVLFYYYFFIRKTIRRVAKQYANSCRDLIILQLPELVLDCCCCCYFVVIVVHLKNTEQRKNYYFKIPNRLSKELTENSFCRLKTVFLFFCTKFLLTNFTALLIFPSTPHSSTIPPAPSHRMEFLKIIVCLLVV